MIKPLFATLDGVLITSWLDINTTKIDEAFSSTSVGQ